MEEKITAWIARDEDNSIHIFNGKPAKTVFMWVPCVYGFHVAHDYKLKLESLLFPEAKWEDKEPTKVELTIKICENVSESELDKETQYYLDCDVPD